MYHSLLFLIGLSLNEKLFISRMKLCEFALIILDLVNLDVFDPVNLHGGHVRRFCLILILFYVEFIIVV